MYRTQHAGAASPRRRRFQSQADRNATSRKHHREQLFARCISESLEARTFLAATTLINEDFSTAASADRFTAVGGGAWAVTQGAFEATEFSKVSTTHLNTRAVHKTSVNGDFDLTVDAAVPNKRGARGIYDAAVIFGYADPNNYYYFSVADGNDSTTSGLFRVVGGHNTQLADVSSRIVVGSTYKLRVQRDGGQLRAYRDGVLIASAADSTFISGAVGFGSNSNASRFDNLLVTTPAPDPTPEPIPAAPTGLVAATNSSTSIDLAWADRSDNESGFKLERFGAGGWTQFATVGANATGFAVGDLAPGTTYQFRVRAYNASGDSAYSNAASATTASVIVIPAAPTALAALPLDSTAIDLAWTDNSDNEFGFQVDIGIGGAWDTIAVVDADSTGYEVSSLSPATTYQFRVRAFNDAGNSAYSNIASATTDDVAPLAPSGLTAAASGSDEIDLRWSDASDNESGFSVESRSTGDTTWEQVATLGANATSYTASGLAAATAYEFRVAAFNDVGDSPYSNTAGATTAPAPVVPLITEDFAAGAGNFDVVDGPWSVVSGAYRITADNNAATTHLNSRAVHDKALVGDFTLTVDATALAAGAPWANAAVIFGYQDASNYYFFSSNQGNDAATNGIFRVVNGTSTQLADAAATITPGTTYQLRVERQGSAIRAYRNGQLVASAADASFTTGRVGLGARQFQASFDNLVVTGTAAVPPSAPSGLAATASSSSSVALQWSDNSSNESGFKIERSTNGSAWTPIASVGANVEQYTASGLAGSTAYQFRVRAFGVTGDSAYSNTASATTPAAPASVLVSPPQAAVDAAIAAPLIRYSRTLPGGAHTDGAFHGGASVTLALAAYAGNTTADARLLQQMRYTLTGGNDISANGGYPAQHERHVTGMFTLAKLTPRIWNQLSSAEQNKVNLLMKAAFIASAFTTSDNNPYVKTGQQQRALDADTNLNRDWNPNYREGMVGGVLVGVSYFGAAAAQQILDTYNHQAFVSELSAAGLTNIAETFNWKQANPTSIAPDGATIQQGLQNYAYYGIGLNNLMAIYGRLVTNTYGKAVNAGLNSGLGLNGGGMLVAGADTLPNKGATGMLTEFDSVDASGPRSAANYSYDGYRPHQTNLLVLIATGNWDANSPVAADAKARLEIGNTDLWYKMDQGYINYYHGAPRETFRTSTHATSWGFTYNRATWENVLRPYLNGQNPTPTPTAPAAPSGLSATASGSDRIDLTWTDASDNELGFVIETLADGAWSTVSVAAADATSYAVVGGLAPATTYQFRVRAFNDAGNSASSNTAAATTAPAPATPVISENFASGAGNFAVVDGAWSLVNGAYRLTADNNTVTTHLNSRSVHNVGLAGDFTLTVDATAFAAAAPWANAAVVFGYQDASNYYFFSSNQGNDAATNGIFKVVNGTSTELADAASTITPGVAYQLRVERQGSQIRAYRNGQLVASATDATFTSGQVGVGTRQFQASFDNFVVAGTAVAPPTNPPAAPSSLTASAASRTTINLAWADNSTDESGFKIERSTNGSTWTQVGAVGANVRTFAAGGLSAATRYFFRVRGTNAAGDSAYSNTADATTPAAPVPGARPGADNTGPTNPSVLQLRGSMVINTPGVYENFEIRNGTIEINADNVTIRNFRIIGGGPWFAIQAYGARQNIVIEDGEITNPNGDNVVVGSGITLRRMNVHDAWDMVRPGSNFVIEDSWFHELRGGATAHADFIQAFGASNVVIRNNFFDAATGTGLNSNITADVSNFNWLVEGNTFKGCGFGLHINGVSTGFIRYLNNEFVAGSFTYGPVRVQSGLQLIEWSGNTWDNGDPLPKPTVQG